MECIGTAPTERPSTCTRRETQPMSSDPLAPPTRTVSSNRPRTIPWVILAAIAGLCTLLAACDSSSTLVELSEPRVGPDDGPNFSTVSVRTIVVSPESVSLDVGGETELDATEYWPSGGVTQDPDVNWRSSDDDVARVDAEGRVRGLAPGEATISASRGGRSGEATVRVGPSSGDDEPTEDDGESTDEENGEDETGEVAHIAVSPSSESLELDESLELRVRLRDGNGDAVPGEDVRWSSSNPSVVSVDGNGTRASATARGGGEAVITAAAGGAKGSSTLTVQAPRPPSGSPPAAFPGAQGYGATALSRCDRSNPQLLRVTNGRNSGAGSLRDAFEQVDARRLSVIIFDYAGYIDISSTLPLRDGCLYIAGQTAPEGGVTLRGPSSMGILFRNGVRDVVVRYLRIRLGSAGGNNLVLGAGRDIILDHISSSWAGNMLLTVSRYQTGWGRDIRNVTVRNSIFSEVFANHPTAMQLVDGDPANGLVTERLDLHRNVIAHSSHRNPNIANAGTRFVNNVVYNWNQGAGQSGYAAVVDWINNDFRPGPMTSSRFLYAVTHRCDQPGNPSLFVSGNIAPTNGNDPTADAWNGSGRITACYYRSGDEVGEELDSRWQRSRPLPDAEIPLNILPASRVLGEVLADVGANARVTCDGRWVRHTDPIDARVLREVERGSGPSNLLRSESDVGGFPRISGGSPCADRDGDGLPDAFEERYGGGPTSLRPGDDLNGDGYTNLEAYLNGISPIH